MHQRPILRTLPVLVALALGSGWAAAQSTTGAAGTGGNTGMTSQGSAAKADRKAESKLSHGDKSFIEDAAKGGMFEVQSGQLAAQKASDPQVKEFGNKLVQDHGKANDELMQLAQAKGVKLPEKDKMADKHEMNKLAKLSGDKFDHEFAEHAVKDHEKDIKKFEKAASKLKDQDLKAWAEKQLPVLREHLAMAQKLSGAGGDTHAAGAKGTKG